MDLGRAAQALREKLSLGEHIEKLGDGKYRLLSHDGKNLGTFDSLDAAKKHEGQVEYFKAHEEEEECPYAKLGRLVEKACRK